MSRPFTVGLTGQSGAGKTTALAVLQRFGAEVLDCDAIYHALLASDRRLVRRIGAAFPGTVREGVLDRGALAAQVFADPAALDRLSGLTHPAVKRAVLRRLRKTGAALAAIDAIALFEGALAPLCDVTVAVTAPEAARLLRLTARDGISEQAARARMAAQKDAAWFEARCDHTLVNDGTREDFETACSALFSRLLRENGII